MPADFGTHTSAVSRSVVAVCEFTGPVLSAAHLLENKKQGCNKIYSLSSLLMMKEDSSITIKEYTMNGTLGPPSTSTEFDRAYGSLLHWMWSDLRIPGELKELVASNRPKNSLELGCGLGRFSSYLAEQGIMATGVDFSSLAIEKAQKRTDGDTRKPAFIVGDVTDLHMITEKFDMSFDVGCFHCLDEAGHRKYVDEVYRLLRPGAIHLLWTLDNSPGNVVLNQNYISDVFGNRFQLKKSTYSGRRILFVASHWYWLLRAR
jgi:SAM-dependent methyltransferase